MNVPKVYFKFKKLRVSFNQEVIAADIIATVIHPAFEEIAILASIVVI